MSSVSVILLCPSLSDTTFIFSPLNINNVACVCLLWGAPHKADYDCATDQDADNCPLGTHVYAEDVDTITWGEFYKWDVGPLQGKSEPRIVDVWNKDIFGQVFNISDPDTTGLIHNGFYYHF